MRSSWRSSVVAGASALMLAASIDLGAHRKDEYLQAARIALDPDRAHITLDLTAGMSVADLVLTEIDRDWTGTISADEGAAYAESVRRDISLELDGRLLTLQLSDNRFPDIETIRKGDGAISLELTAAIPALPAGPHRLRYRNSHRTDIGAYLANVLRPETTRVAIAAQQRDPAQRELVVDYVLDGDSAANAARTFLPDVAVLLLICAALWWRERSHPRKPAS